MTLVTFDLWRVPRRRAAHAAARMLLDRPALRRVPGLTFAKLLGTGSGRTFTPRDADPTRWALVAVWESPRAARSFERSRTIQSWGCLADERWHVDLSPLRSRGRWSGRDPFSRVPSGHAPGGNDPTWGVPGGGARPVAAITRARLAPRHALTFWRAVPPVVAGLRASSGLLFAIGIGEAPVGLQGTFSLWSDDTALRAFAYRRAEHLAAVRRTPEVGWYAEELFARFAVLGSRHVFGIDPLVPPHQGGERTIVS